MKVDIYNIKGKKLNSKIDLSNKVFSIKPNEHTIYLAIKSELAARRQGTSSSKNRSEVAGSGRKLWRQKGSGRARVGSSRNPSRVHGGAAFGPEPRQYKLKVNKKVKKNATRSALSIKIKSNLFKIVDELVMKDIKTKEFNQILTNLGLNNSKVTIIIGSMNENLYLSSRNLYNVNLVPVDNVSTYDIMNSNTILFDKSSIEKLNERLN